jgi:hypothetical protein
MEASSHEVSQQLAWEGALNRRLFHVVGIQLKSCHMTSTLGDSIGEKLTIGAPQQMGVLRSLLSGLGLSYFMRGAANFSTVFGFSSLFVSFNRIRSRPVLSPSLPFYFSCKQPPLRWDGEDGGCANDDFH